MPSNYSVEMWMGAVWDDRPWQRFGSRDEGDTFPPNGAIMHVCEVPEPFQAAMDDEWVVYIPSGKWSARIPQCICPLEHPVDLSRDYPQTTAIGAPHFNIERTNPEWR